MSAAPIDTAAVTNHIKARIDGMTVQDAITYHELSSGKALPAEAKERLLEVEKNTLAAPKACMAPVPSAPAL